MTAVRVIFRKWPRKHGEVLAFFPDLPGNSDPSTCLSYQHTGQHGAASVALVDRLARTTAAERAPLVRELRGIGYRLRIVDRMPRDSRRLRQVWP